MNTNEENFLIKHNDKISDKFGCNPYERSFDELINRSVIIADKDSGPTSHQVSENLKNILKVEKAGHAGTLDPKVTGILLCGVGKATRLMEYMLISFKEYVCLMYLHKPQEKNKIEKALKQFTGKIKQTPPIISAVKREERIREIYYNQLLDIEDDNQHVLFRVGCQHGTYIRKLCTDIGEYLGCNAQMRELRRTKAGPFREEDGIISLDKLRNLYEMYRDTKNNSEEEEVLEKELRKYIRPYEEALADFKKVYVRDNAVDSIAHGSDLAIPGVAKLSDNIQIGEEIAMLTQKGELIGMGIAYLNSKDVIKKNKGAFIKTHKVFIDPEYYPSKWEFS